jgi:hypothetical protein
MPTFGTRYDPAHYVAIPDPDYYDSEGTTKTKHPAAGTELLVVDADTLTALSPIEVLAYGEWEYTSATADWINVSGDGGVNWVGPLQSIENKQAAGESGATAALALDTAGDALLAAQNALTVAQSGGGGGSSVEEIYETAAGVYPVPTSTIRRIFIGQVRPTLAQGRRNNDLWRNVVYAT